MRRATYGDAIHEITPAVHLGAVAPDAETQPLYSANADGDDTNNMDDEDGVNFNPALGSANWVLAGARNSLVVTASVNGILNAWIDLNRNGVFTDTGEHIFTELAVQAEHEHGGLHPYGRHYQCGHLWPLPPHYGQGHGQHPHRRRG